MRRSREVGMDPYEIAARRVKRMKGFYRHLGSFVLVNGAFLLVTALEGDPFGWLPIVFFWGIGLGSHYLSVFGFPGTGVMSKEWEEKEIQKELKKQQPYLKAPKETALPEESVELPQREILPNQRDESELI